MPRPTARSRRAIAAATRSVAARDGTAASAASVALSDATRVLSVPVQGAVSNNASVAIDIPKLPSPSPCPESSSTSESTLTSGNSSEYWRSAWSDESTAALVDAVIAKVPCHELPSADHTRATAGAPNFAKRLPRKRSKGPTAAFWISSSGRRRRHLQVDPTTAMFPAWTRAGLATTTDSTPTCRLRFSEPGEEPMAPYNADCEDDSVASLRRRMITQADLDAAKSAIKAQRNLPKMPDDLSVLRCIEHCWFNLLRQPSRTRARAGRDAVLHILQKESTHAARRVRNLALESQRTGDVNESGQGRHAKRNRIIDIEFVHADCTAMLDDRRRTSARQFHEWLNQYLEHHGSQMVTERTSRKSLTIDLGFRRHSRKKGVYYNGHDREDVQQYLHDVYIPALERIDSRCRKYYGDTMEVEFQRENISLPEIRKFFHDESIFYTDDAEKHYYARDGDQVLRKKSLGRCLHVSDMISEDCGFLDLQKALSSSGYEQLQRAGTLPANTKSRGIIRPGKNADGWWDHEQLVNQVIHFMDLFEIAYPGEIVCLFFDCSANHAAFAKDALVVNRMNINPGGKQSVMRDAPFVHKCRGICHLTSKYTCLSRWCTPTIMSTLSAWRRACAPLRPSADWSTSTNPRQMPLRLVHKRCVTHNALFATGIDVHAVHHKRVFGEGRVVGRAVEEQADDFSRVSDLEQIHKMDHLIDELLVVPPAVGVLARTDDTA